MTLSPALDLFPLSAAILAAVACGTLGNLLLLRRLSLVGDAISHSVLPGLVIAFLLVGSRAPLPMFLGAAIAGLVTVLLIEFIKRVARVEPGAATGVVFSVLFALGVLLIERAAVRQVDLDADCVLHGQLETLWWTDAPASFAAVLSPATLAAVPRQVWTLLAAATASLAFVTILFKELRLAAFDPALATALGFRARLLHHALMALVAAATVASFEAVGSILVIALLVAPAATARLLTDRLRTQILLSIAVAIAAAVLGYLGATAVPDLLGKRSVNAAGSIAVALGLLFTAAVIAAPRRGLIARALHRRALARSVALDDLLAALYRRAELDPTPPAPADLPLPSATLARALPLARRQRLVRIDDAGRPALTDIGLPRARDLVRRHRLWETYLVDRAGLAPDHVHDLAERLEHLPLAPARSTPTDPHGRDIPT